MAEEKLQVDVVDVASLTTPEVAEKWQGTDADRYDMAVVGRPQQLRRNFHYITILGFGCTLVSTWEINMTTPGLGLMNGGTAGIIYGFFVVTAGYGLVYASLAELASMSPTAGGQYHWISEFAPAPCEKFLSYLSGWLCLAGWQAAICAMAFLVGTIIQALIILHYPDTYAYEAWHGTLLVIAIILASFVFNSVLATRLPLVEGVVLLIHVCGLFAIVIPLCVLSPRKSADAVFTEFSNVGGWSSTGVAFMVGLLPLSASVGGIDCMVHMAEEVKDASRTLPRSLMSSLPLNAALDLCMILTLCFCTVDVESVMASPVAMAGHPFIQIFCNATGSLGATTVTVVLPILSLTGSVIAEIATASRQLWSFARDGGVPFSTTIAKVKPRWAIPLNAALISLAINCLLPLINIGSTAALNAFFSPSGVSILSSYILCIGVLLLKRLRCEALPSRRWTLGKFGMAINIAALCFLVPLCIFMFFPSTVLVTTLNMNWGCLMYGAVVLFATAYYVVYGRERYTSPVHRVRRDP